MKRLYNSIGEYTNKSRNVRLDLNLENASILKSSESGLFVSNNDKKSQLLYKLLTSITDANIKIYILNGNTDLIEDYKIIDEKIYLKCKDNYDGLYLKTKKLF